MSISHRRIIIEATMRVATPSNRNSTTDFAEKNSSGVIVIGGTCAILYLCQSSLGIIILGRWYRLDPE